MDNPEIALSVTKNTEQIQTKQKNTTKKSKNISNTDSTPNFRG